MSFEIIQHRPSQAFIHLQNLIHNLNVLRDGLDPQYFFCPMVKANGYGHGDIEIAQALEKNGVQTLGVGLIEEGVLLRQMGIRSQILVYGTFQAKSVREFARWNLTPVVSDWGQIAALENYNWENPLSIHLKFDTGMHRLGFTTSESETLLNRLSENPFLKVQGVLTHLHSAENLIHGSGTSWQQLEELRAIEKQFNKYNPVVHALNSAALIAGLKGPERNEILRFGARPGLALYGYNPIESDVSMDLKPVMSLRSQVVRYHHIKSGDSVSYGATWRASQDATVGVVPLGYADGVHRLLSNQGYVLFGQQRVPIVGNICMDYFMIDVSSVIKGLRIENWHDHQVTLFGFDRHNNLIKASELAEKSKTITWEILTSVSERVPRILEDVN
jgi:alanine racemase